MASNLGRGLESLIPKKTPQHLPSSALSKAGAPLLAPTGEQVLELDPQLISINPWQPRQEFAPGALDDLMNSIKEHGIIQPLIVTQKGEAYELIAGERRLRSAKNLGLKTVPVLVREADAQKKLEIALIENLQRENLNPIETSWAYDKLMSEFNLSQEAVAKRVGKARSTVANSLRLLNLPEEIKTALAQKRLSEAHAKYLLGLSSEAQQLNVFRKILRQNLTVADTNRLIRHLGGTKEARVKDSSLLDKERRLANSLGTKVTIEQKARGGRIIIDFYSDEELGELTRRLGTE